MPRYKNYLILTTIIRVVTDIIAIYVSFMVAFWFRFYSGLVAVPLGIPPVLDYIQGFFISALIMVLVFKSFSLYSQRAILKYSDELGLIVKAVTVGIIILMALTFVERDYSYSRMLVVLCWLLGIMGLALSRYLVGILESWLCSIRKEYKKVLILGTDKIARHLLQKIKESPRWGYQVIGFLSAKEEENLHDIDGVPVLGDLYRFQEVLEKKHPDEVILAITGLSHEQMVNIIMKCEKRLISFKLVPDMFETLTSKVDIYNINGISLLGIKELPLDYVWNRYLKRSFDLVGAVSGLVISIPIFLVLPILIKLTSRGSIFYEQARCGEDGKTFALYKFRTMRVDAESETGPVWAEESDPRCTSIGKWLRASTLDEIPQLFNVVKGDMSLVGPRPERPHFVEKFKENIPRYMSRHLIKSGITGWAQVSGLRGNTALDERIRYDMFYVENWSLFMDIKIIFMTLFARKKIVENEQSPNPNI